MTQTIRDEKGDVPPATNFPVVCLGGSAGSVEPYKDVVRQLPADARLAVVVVNHLRKSATKLPEILTAVSALSVDLITPGMTLEPNRVYVIPPNHNLTLHEGKLQLDPLSVEHGWPTVINVFLESLARKWK